VTKFFCGGFDIYQFWYYNFIYKICLSYPIPNGKGSGYWLCQTPDSTSLAWLTPVLSGEARAHDFVMARALALAEGKERHV
jgi:hypothetical protein